MTTSVIYGSSIRGQNVQYGSADPITTAATIYANLTTFLTTKVTRTRFTNNSGSTTNPTATFSATPAQGSALIAVILRTTDNQATTLSGWTQLSNAGASATRQAAVWWKRAGASEPTVVTATNATAAAWNMTIIEYGGWATLADPVSISNSATVASTTNITVPGTGMHAGVCAIVAGSTWTTATLADDVGNNASYTQFAATTQANCSEIVGYNNYEDATAKYTLGTARATNRLVVGWPHNTTSVLSGGFGNLVGVTTSSLPSAGQVGIEFDTSTIPALNTVSAATLTLKAGGTATLWPSVATSEIYSINSTAIAKTASNTRTVWRTPTEITALTKVASRPAGSAYVVNTAYAWTSDASFISNINQGSTTRLLIGTSEQRTGSLAGSNQQYNISATSGDHFLTIVHQREATVAATATASASTPSRIVAYLRTLPTVTANASPLISRIASLSATIGATADASPVISRVVSLSRTITATVTASPAITRVATLARTISASVQAVPGLVADYFPFTTQLPRVIRLPFSAIVSLSQQTRARISQRSTLRLPKE